MPPPPPPPPSAPPPPAYGGPAFGDTPAPTLPYAGFWQRFLGYLLDGILYGLVSLVFVIPAIALFFAATDGCDWVERRNDEWDLVCPPGEPDGALITLAIGLALLGVVLVAILYIRALGNTGQTWGRKIAGVKVIRKENPTAPLGIGKALLRVLVAGIVSGNCILGYLWMLWDKDKQTWHDKIVSTVVIKV